MDDFKEGEVEDLASLSRLDEKVLLNELKVRYNKDRIYVSRSTCLIRINVLTSVCTYFNR